MRRSRKSITKVKRIDLDDEVNSDSISSISECTGSTETDICNHNTSGILIDAVTPRTECTISISRPSFTVPDANVALFYQQALEKIVKPTKIDKNSDDNHLNKNQTIVNALLSPRMNLRSSKSLSSQRSSTVEDDEGLLQVNQYRILEDLGNGSYGSVKLVEDSSGQLFALKAISKRKLMKSCGYFRRPPPLRINSKTSGSFCNGEIRETVSQNSSPSTKTKFKPNSFYQSNGSTNDTESDSHSDPLRRIYQEVAIYKKLNHLNIVKLKEVIDEPNEDKIYMIFEYIEGGPVMNVGVSEPMSEENARKYMRDILSGLEYLHFNKIVHRDIKPSNLLVDKNGTVKMIDFGVSCQFTGDDIFLQDTLGSPAFLAPEVVQDVHSKFAGKALDIWALGMTLYCFLFGKVAFEGRNKIDLYHTISTKPVKIPEVPEISTEARDLLTQMLCKNPKERIRLDEIMVHPWITDNGSWFFPTISDGCIKEIEVTDREIDECTVKPVRIETIVSALMMMRQRSFRNPKRHFTKPLNKHEHFLSVDKDNSLRKDNPTVLSDYQNDDNNTRPSLFDSFEKTFKTVFRRISQYRDANPK